MSDRATLLRPLDELYARAGEVLPAVEPIMLGAIPEPLRHLLAGDGDDMTSRLERHCGQAIRLRVLARRRRADVYTRQVVLTGDDDRCPVAVAALEVWLDRCAPGVRRRILDERTPLGHILREHGEGWSREACVLFRLHADRLIGDALGRREEGWLYGRRARLVDAQRTPLAEVVEILGVRPAPARVDPLRV